MTEISRIRLVFNQDEVEQICALADKAGLNPRAYVYQTVFGKAPPGLSAKPWPLERTGPQALDWHFVPTGKVEELRAEGKQHPNGTIGAARSRLNLSQPTPRPRGKKATGTLMGSPGDRKVGMSLSKEEFEMLDEQAYSLNMSISLYVKDRASLRGKNSVTYRSSKPWWLDNPGRGQLLIGFSDENYLKLYEGAQNEGLSNSGYLRVKVGLPSFLAVA